MSKKRRLPFWVDNTQKDHNMSKKSRLTSWVDNTHKDLEQLKFSGTVVYTQIENEANLFCSELLENCLDEPLVVGFDTEWDIKGSFPEIRTDLIQVCPSDTHVYLFHISCMGNLPACLRRLIENPYILKTGVNIRNDIYRLQKQFDVASNGFDLIDLSEMANHVLLSSQCWSLDRLCEHVLKKQLPKDHSTRCSRWSDFHLSNEQISYAATDAYVSRKLYSCLKAKEKP